MGSDEQSASGRTPVTLASIAGKVGVSVNTVSRAIRAPSTVRPELRRQIAAAMEELNYVPNRLAGGLAGTRSDIVGVVVTSLYYSEFATIIDTLQSSLLSSKLQVMLANTRYDEEEEAKLVRSILSWRPAAIAIIGVDHHPKVEAMLRAAEIPILEMWDTSGRIIDSAVGIDHRAVGAAQAQHLIEQGYRNLAFLGSMRDNDARARKRAAGACQSVEAAGLAPLVMATRQESGNPDLGSELALALLNEHPDVDGIVCNSDAIAFGVLRAMRQAGRRVPEDIGVIGFGDSEASACMTPSLTSVRPDRESIGRLTAEMILARIADSTPETMLAEWRIVERDSSRK